MLRFLEKQVNYIPKELLLLHVFIEVFNKSVNETRHIVLAHALSLLNAPLFELSDVVVGYHGLEGKVVVLDLAVALGNFVEATSRNEGNVVIYEEPYRVCIFQRVVHPEVEFGGA